MVHMLCKEYLVPGLGAMLAKIPEAILAMRHLGVGMFAHAAGTCNLAV